MADLGRWLSEDYRIAADPDEDADGLSDEDSDRTTD
jgi:endogenous inhibitor of DNA gyrase (YacG/DUF329 family)